MGPPSSGALRLILTMLALSSLACSSRVQGGHDAAPSPRPRHARKLAPPKVRCAVEGTPTRVSTSPGRSLGPAVAWVGEDALVVWVEERGETREVMAARLEGGKNVHAPVVLGGSAALPPVAVARSGDGAVAFYADERDRIGEVYARRLAPAGVPAGPEKKASDAARRELVAGQRIRLPPLASGARDPALLSNDEGVLAAFVMSQPPRSQVFHAQWGRGDEIGAPIRATVGPSDVTGPALARAGAATAIAYCAGVPGRYDVLLANLAAGRAGAPRRLAETEWGPCAPAIGAIDARFIVAWADGTPTQGRVEIATIGAEGEADTARTLGAIAPRAPGMEVHRLVSAVSFTAGAVLAWTGPTGVQVALVDGSGVVGSETTIERTRHPADPALATHRDVVLVAWHDEPAPGEAEEIFVARVACR